MSVPTYGAIILDPEMKFVLLVQGYWAKSSWGFPKGKINEDETEQECAVREVFEETGFNISKFINSNDYFENQMNDQLTRLYIIAGVSLDTEFQTKTRKEIKCMQWFPVDALPAHKKDQTCRSQLNMNSNNFFTIIPFIKQLRKWIMNKKQQNLDLKTGILGPVPNGSTVTNVTIPVTGNCRQLTDKQRLKQQQLYNQKLFNDFQEYQKMKDGKINTGQVSANNSGGSKLMSGNGDSNHLATETVNTKYQRNRIQQTASPKQHYKKILTRDKDDGYSLSEITLTKAHSWTNFKLNFEALWT
uniref:mRNA-decapping enzyme 2 n=2 Tax=Octopus bimaculoides TaxID=37653 RepID=A0A0L8HJ63_OCTBM